MPRIREEALWTQGPDSFTRGGASLLSFVPNASTKRFMAFTYAFTYDMITPRRTKEHTVTSITATAFRQNIYRTIDQVNANCAPITITNTKGKGAVLIGEDDWAAIEETLYLASIPDMVESLQVGRKASLDECVTEDSLEW